MEAIILSGPPAVGKTTVSKLLSKRLGFPTVGGTDILKEMAADRGYKMSGDDWWDTPEAMRFVKERESNTDFDKEVDRRLLKKVDEGNVIITTYTMPWLAKKGFKVWLEGTIKNRAHRMAERDHSNEGIAEKMLRQRQEENDKIYSKLYGIDFEHDRSPFHLQVDTNKAGAEEVTDMIVKKYQERNAKK